MSTNSLLTGDQLISLKSKSDKELPHIGEKDFSPSNTWLEKSHIQNTLSERKNLIEEQRVEKRNNLSCATWMPEVAKAKVGKKVGKHWESLSHHSDGSDWLYPEEALVLLETNCLELLLYEVPLSIERAYSTLICEKHGCNLGEYRVYSHLVRNGYRLYRHSSSVSVTRYEKDIHLVQHVLNDKSLYSADCDADKTAVPDKTVAVNSEPSASPNLSVESVVECRSSPVAESSSSSSSCEVLADKSANESEMHVDVVGVEADEAEVSVVATVPSSQFSTGAEKPEVIDLSSGDDEEEEEEEDEDESDDSVVEVPVEEKEIIYAEISSDECESETENIYEDLDRDSDDDDDDNDNNEDEDDDDNDSSSDDDGANWKRRTQQTNVPSSSDVNKESQSKPIPIRTTFVTDSEFLFVKPNKQTSKDVKPGVSSLNQEVDRFYKEIEVIDLDSDVEDDNPIPQINVRPQILPRGEILKRLHGLMNYPLRYSAPDKYLPNGVEPVDIEYKYHFNLDYRTVLRQEHFDNYNNRQKNTSYFNKYRESRMRMPGNLIVQRPTPFQQQQNPPHMVVTPFQQQPNPPHLVATPFQQTPPHMAATPFQQQLKLMAGYQVATIPGTDSLLMNNIVKFNPFNSFANNVMQMVSTMPVGPVRDQFQQRIQLFGQAMNNHQNNCIRPPSLLGDPLIPNPNVNAMGYQCQDFLGFFTNNTNQNSPFQGSLNQNLVHNSQQNVNSNMIASVNNVDASQSAGSSGTNCATNLQNIVLDDSSNNDYIPINSCVKNENRNKSNSKAVKKANRANRLKMNKKMNKFMKQLKEFMNKEKEAQSNTSLAHVNVKSETPTKSKKKAKKKNKRDKLQMNKSLENDSPSSPIIFDTTGGDPAVFVEDIPLIVPPPNQSILGNRNDSGTLSASQFRRKRRNKMKLFEKANGTVAKKIKRDPESIQGKRTPKRCKRYFGIENAERMLTTEPRPVVKRECATDGDVIVIDHSTEANAPRIKSEAEPVASSREPTVSVCDEVEEVDRKPSLNDLATVEVNGTEPVIEVKQEVLDISSVKEEPQSADEFRKEMANSTTVVSDTVLGDLSVKTEIVDEDSVIPVPETCEESVEAVSWAQLKEKAPTTCVASPQASNSEADSDEDENILQPILTPRDCQSLSSVYKALQVVESASFSTANMERLKITFDVYIPSPSFKKSSRGLPNYRLVIKSCSEPLPSAHQMAELSERFEDCVPILIAVVLPDSISFLNCGLVNLPTLDDMD